MTAASRISAIAAAARTLRLLALVIAMLGFAAAPARAVETVLVQFGSSMRYKANTTNPGIGTAWTAAGFNDASWTSGTYGVGYELNLPGAQALLQTTVASHAYSVYTRAHFTVADPSAFKIVSLGLDYDDGCVAWINGVEVFRSSQMPAGAPAWNTNSALHESSNGATPNYAPLQDISAAALAAIVPGDNVLAIGVWNSAAATSSDLVLVPRLAISPYPSLVRGPYLQMGATNRMVVRWRTDAPSQGDARFGAAPNALGTVVTDPSFVTDHAVALTGLAPATTYFYAVGDTVRILAGGDAAHSFHTSPTIGSKVATRIWALGDSGTANDNARAVRDAYDTYTGAVPTDLWLMLGDNAYSTGLDNEFQAAVFDMYPAMLARAPLWPTYGNHDGASADSATQTGPYYDVFSLPAAAQSGGISSGTEAYYSFDYANVHFVCLDSFESSRAVSGPMLTWLSQDLLATTQDWIIAFWHHPPYTKGSHNSDTETDLTEIRENFLPILEANGVDLVLCGHSHSYERSYFIDGHYGMSGTFSSSNQIDAGDGRLDGTGAYTKAQLGAAPHEGAVYTVAGSSGQISGGALNHPAMFVSLNVLGSLVLDLLGNRIDTAFVDDDGVVRDHFTLIKGGPLAPAADFAGGPASGPVPLMTSFRDRSTNSPTTWSWDFNADGTAEANVQNPSHQYTQPGLYSVALTAANGAGAGQKTRTAYVCATQGSAPPPVAALRPGAGTTTLLWTAQASGTVYDVVKGSLGQLAATHGNFALSLTGCLANRTPNATASDLAIPAPGSGFFYVARAIDCALQAGTYDSGAASQVGLRDAEIAASGSRCP